MIDIPLADRPPHLKGLLLLLLGVVSLWLLSLSSYLLMHSIAECFSVIIAFSVFIFAWNSRRYLQDNFLVFLGVGYLFAASFDMLHVFAYKGMNVFSAYGADLATQLWVAARFIHAATWLGALLLIGRRVRLRLALPAQLIVFAVLAASIFWWRNFPRCYVDGVGLTPFKVAAEWVFCAVFAGSIGVLWRHRERLDPGLYRLLLWTAGLTVASEICFTLYVGVYDFPNFLGHYLKVLYVYLTYLAIIRTGMIRPLNVLFRDLQEERAGLERRVVERTAELVRANERLRSLADQLSLAEERERRRLATEIHDNLSQTLALSKMGLAGLRRQVAPELEPHVRELLGLLDEAISNTRSITFELSPPVLYRLGFEPAVQWLGEQAQARHGLRFELHSDGRPAPLADDTRTILFQSVREVFANIVKHAQAQAVTVSLGAVDGMFEVVVEDDGVGFDLQRVTSAAEGNAGFGLFNISERLEHLGGSFTIDSAPDLGTRVTLTVPVAAEEPGT